MNTAAGYKKVKPKQKLLEIQFNWVSLGAGSTKNKCEKICLQQMPIQKMIYSGEFLDSGDFKTILSLKRTKRAT